MNNIQLDEYYLKRLKGAIKILDNKDKEYLLYQAALQQEKPEEAIRKYVIMGYLDCLREHEKVTTQEYACLKYLFKYRLDDFINELLLSFEE